MSRLKEMLRTQAEGKALPDHPVFHDHVPTSLYVPGGNRTREPGQISQREAPRHLQAYGGDQAIDWVMDCVRLYADSASSSEWLFKKNGKLVYPEDFEGRPPDTEVAPADLVRLLNEPNPYMDYEEMIELLVIDLLLVGNAYWYKYRMSPETGKPLALYRLAPPYVKIKPGGFGPEAYEYAPPNAKPIKIDPVEVMHFKLPNPHSAFYGLGIIQGGGRAFDMELALTDSLAHYFENKADPSLVIQSERRVPRDVFNKLRAQLRARIAGRHNTGELLVLEAGLKANPISPSAQEALYDKLADMSRDRVYSKFRCSPKLFGQTENASASDKVQDARREFDNNTMAPFVKKLSRRITRGLVGAWDLDFVIPYEYVMPQEELVKLSSDFSSLPGIKVREIRRFLRPIGIAESTGDSEIDEMVLNLPGEELDEDGQGGFPDRSLEGEAGRPPKGENTRAFPREGEPLPANARARRAQGKALTIDEITDRLGELEGKAVTLETPGRTTIGNKLIGEQRPPDPAAEARDGDVDAVIAGMIPNLRQAVDTLERGLLDHVEGKAFQPSDLKARIARSAAWKGFRNLIDLALKEGARSAVSTAAIHQAASGVRPDGDLDYEAIVESVMTRSDSITDTLKQEIIAKVARAIEEDKSRPEVEQVVREAIDFWRQTQSETVAMTEAVHAYNEGTLTVLEAAGHDEVFVSDGHDHDEACRDADGSVWTIDHARQNRLEHPRCRRAFVALAA